MELQCDIASCDTLQRDILSWHGILLAETARLSPEGNVGGITGGVLAFTSIAMMVYPAIYGTLLALTDSYGLGFTFAAVPAMFCAFVFFYPALKGRGLQDFYMAFYG